MFPKIKIFHPNLQYKIRNMGTCFNYSAWQQNIYKTVYSKKIPPLNSHKQMGEIKRFDSPLKQVLYFEKRKRIRTSTQFSNNIGVYTNYWRFFKFQITRTFAMSNSTNGSIFVTFTLFNLCTVYKICIGNRHVNTNTDKRS